MTDGADFPAKSFSALECVTMFKRIRKAMALARVSAKATWMNRPQRGASMSSYVIGIAVAALIVAIIIPIAFGQFFSVNTGSWDAQTVLIWGIIPLVIILAIVLYFLNKADDQA